MGSPTLAALRGTQLAHLTVGAAAAAAAAYTPGPTTNNRADSTEPSIPYRGSHASASCQPVAPSVTSLTRDELELS